MSDLEQLASRAVEWARDAGRISIERRNLPLEISYKTSPSDLVTMVDKEVEKYICGKILESYPDHGIVGEEGTFERDPADFDTLWIIDPIDGTTNFVHQQINYVISIAVVHKGKGVLGVIYDPGRDELFFAQTGKGAFLNGQRLQLNKPVTLQESLICTSLFWSHRAERYGLDKLIYELPHKCRGIRVFGCAAMEMAYVAAGRVDAYVSLSLNPWDFAAGKIILEEAGGKTSAIDGSALSFEKKSTVIAVNAHLFDELTTFMKSFQKED